MPISFPLSQGARGVAVADLQRKLASLDPREVREIKLLQKMRCALPDGGGAPSGEYGPETVAAINGRACWSPSSTRPATHRWPGCRPGCSPA